MPINIFKIVNTRYFIVNLPFFINKNICFCDISAYLCLLNLCKTNDLITTLEVHFSSLLLKNTASELLGANQHKIRLKF